VSVAIRPLKGTQKGRSLAIRPLKGTCRKVVGIAICPLQESRYLQHDLETCVSLRIEMIKKKYTL
jgi:hypothetical protein